MNKNNNKDFIDFIQEETKSEQKQSDALKVFLRLVPEVYQKFVTQTIENYYGGDVEKYKKSIPLFIEKFKYKDRDICDKNVVGIKKNKIRKFSKLRKQTILWAGQLLKLVGKNAMEIVPYAVLNQYLKDIAEQETFCKKHKLMNAKGKLVRLTTPTERKKQRNAQNYKIAKLQEEMAKQRDFTFAFITLTLPPEYHPNPTKGRNSYMGARPQETVSKLNEYWELIRANLAKKSFLVGSDFFGMQVVEGHKDSCLHKHILVHIAPENLPILQEVVKGVETREREKIALRLGVDIEKVKLKFDFKINNGKAKASTYLFKYISPDLNNKAALKNEALRSAYGVRSFSFFGVQNKLGTFNHIVKNWKSFKDEIKNQEVIQMLEEKDLSLFYFKYHQDFKNITVKKEDGKYEFLGVSYIEDRFNQNQYFSKSFKSFNEVIRDIELSLKGILKTEILIAKKQFVIIENEDRATVKNYCSEMRGMKLDDDLNLFEMNLSIAERSFPVAQEKQKAYNDLLLRYFEEQSKKGIDNYASISDCYYSQISELAIRHYFDEDLEESKEVFNSTFEDTYFDYFNGIKKDSELELDLENDRLRRTLKAVGLYTELYLNNRYSRKNTSCFSELEKPPAKASQI